MTSTATEHASCVVVGEAGILIRGASGCGKSSLALALVDWALRDGRFGALVADDRVILERRHGRILARSHPATAGLAEIRGLGLVRRPYEAGVVVRLVVDRDRTIERLPDPEALWTDILGIRLARAAIGPSTDPVRLAAEHLRACESALRDTVVTIT